MFLHNLMRWMADTRWSVDLHESRYAYSIVESIHVWTLCLFVGFAILLDLRLLGVTLKSVPMSQITTRILPWTKAAFVLMVISGLLLFFAIPLRTYPLNPGRLASTMYGPIGRFVSVYNPVSSLMAVRLAPVAVCVALISTPGKTAPD